jgi:hypothetical protein
MQFSFENCTLKECTRKEGTLRRCTFKRRVENEGVQISGRGRFVGGGCIVFFGVCGGGKGGFVGQGQYFVCFMECSDFF